MSGSDLPIRLDGVSVVMGLPGQRVSLLDDVTLTLTEGAPTVLVGPNGAGKTSLLKAAMGLLKPTQGRVTWDGRDAVPPEKRAFVFQRPVMLRRSAADNLRYAMTAGPRQTAQHSTIAALLALVGLEHAADRPARRLSGGEQHRLALARALARDPLVLFLDEPTASLDPASTKAVEEVIRKVAQRGIKVVMSTHDLHEARRLAGEIVLLNQGRIVETADASSFFDAPRTVEARRFIAGELLA